MNDASNPTPPDGAPANGTPNGVAAGPDAAAQVRVLAQYIKDFSFENPNAPQSLASTQAAPDVRIGIDVKLRDVGNNHHECILEVQASASRDEMTLFVIELHYAGLFHLENVAEENVQPIMLIEAPRILFPFARRLVADTTRDGGFMPLLLDPIDFATLYRQQRANQPPVTGSQAEPHNPQSVPGL